MYDLSPEMANREDSRYWFVDGDLNATKPGDIVIVEEVIGDRFGKFDRVHNLGMAATFLGQFSEDEEESLEIAHTLINP